MLIRTNLHPRDYSEKEVCRIVNPKQCNLYIKHNVYPIDIYSSIDDEEKSVTVMIFLKEETKELYQLWLNHELN